MNFVRRLKSVEVSPRTAAICIGTLMLAAAVVVVTSWRAANSADSSRRVDVRVTEVKNPPKVSAKAKAKSKPAAEKANAKKDAKAAPVKASAVAPAPSPYAVIVERNLFRPLTQTGPSPQPNKAPAPPSVGKMPVLPAGKSGGPPPPTPSPSGGSDIKKTLAFTGVVETSDGAQALLENIQTNECRFVKQGDSAFGCRITNINSQMLSLEKDGSSFTLNIGENKSDSGGAVPPQGGGGKPKEGGPPKPG